jgi:four helix bundle protein
MSISLKEAEESRYWLELLTASNHIDAEQSSELLNVCDEIIRMLASIVKTMREKTLNS